LSQIKETFFFNLTANKFESTVYGDVPRINVRGTSRFVKAKIEDVGLTLLNQKEVFNAQEDLKSISFSLFATPRRVEF